MIPEKTLRDIENLRTSPNDRANIVLVHGGLKPSSAIDNGARGLYKRDIENRLAPRARKYTSGNYFVDHSYVAGIENLLDELNLVHETEFYTDLMRDRHTNEYFSVMYGSNMKNLNMLMNAARMEWNSSRCRSFGEAFGFTPLNIDYFVGDRVVDKSVSEVELTPEERKMMSVLSYVTEMRDPGAVKESLELARKYAAYLKNVSPRLYGEVTEL